MDYQCNGGVDEFIVHYVGSRYSIRIPELSLVRRSIQDLEQSAARSTWSQRRLTSSETRRPCR